MAVDRIDAVETGDTEWVDWRLAPVETRVERLVVPTVNRGYTAVVEATVAASQLDVDANDEATLRSRLDYLGGVAR